MTDEIDRAQLLEEREREASISRAVRRREAAPARAGHCSGCDDAIEPERLAANPHAARCLECQEAAERLDAMRRKPGMRRPGLGPEKPASFPKMGREGVW